MRYPIKTTLVMILAACAAAVLDVPQARAQTRQANPATATPAESLVVGGLDDAGRVRLVPGKSTVITTRRPQKRISIGDPNIVDVAGISPTRILATAKNVGSTHMIIWDEEDRSQTIDVVVQPDVSGLREQLDRIFPDNKIEATASGDSVVLSGRVGNILAAEQATLLAQPYGKSVVNLIEISGGQQVLLQVRVAEVSRTATRQLGMNFGFTDGTAQFGNNVGQVAPLGFEEVGDAGGVVLSVPEAMPSTVTQFGTGMVGDTAFAYFISAMRDNNLLRVLAEPNLVAISGEEASFLAGGEFPIPVPQSSESDTITIEFREFGVRLRFVPVVLGDGRIRLKLAPEVSDLDFSTAVRFGGFVIPGLTQRKVSTTVEIPEGQTLAIAGLLNQTVAANKSVTPLLGDVPVIGALFRSVRYQQRETELVILVTPRLIESTPANQVAPLPGENWRHPGELELFLNQDLGGETEADGDPVQGLGGSRRAPRPYMGSAGFAPATRSSETSR